MKLDQFALENSVCWYGHVLKGAFDFEVEGQRKKGMLNRTLKKQVDEESLKVGLRREDALFRSKCIIGIKLITTRLR